VFNHNTAEVMRARVKQAQIEGRDDVGVQQAAAEGKAQALAARLQAMAVNDPVRAYSILEKNKDVASVVDRKSGVSYYDALANEFRGRKEQQNGQNAGKESLAAANLDHPFANPALPVWARAVSTGPQGFSPSGLARTIRIESGGNPNAVNGNAVGLGQFMPAAWDQFGQGDRRDPAQSILATQRYAAANAQTLKGTLGREPTDAELYLAHQQGPGGAAKLLANPDARAGSLVGDAAIRSNGGDPNAPAWMFTNMWVERFNGSQSWQASAAPSYVEQRPSVRASAYTRLMNSPDLNPNELAHGMAYVHQTLAAQEIAENNNEKANKRLVEEAANEYTTAMHTGQFTDETYANLVKDPRLDSDWKTRDALINISRTQSGSDRVSATLAYGPGFWSAYKSITAPLGDPNRVTDPTALLPRAGPGGDLTLAGVQKLQETMAVARKSVDDKAVQASLSGVIAAAKSKLSFDGEMTFPNMPPKRDIKGEQIFNEKFLPTYLGMFDRWVKDGKDPMEFISDQDRRDKLIQQLRPKSQMDMDRVSATGEQTGDKVDQTIPPPPAGVDPKQWNEVMSVRPIVPSGQPVHPLNWAHIITILRQNPTPDMIKHFDEMAPGFNGREILKKLGVATEASPNSEFGGPPPGARPLLPGETITGTMPVKEEEKPQPKHFWERLPATMLPPELRGRGGV
jgi:Transglycosylase SLT domain